jgi:hypothetical protein
MFGIKRKQPCSQWIPRSLHSTSICQIFACDDTTDNVETTDEIRIGRWARMAVTRIETLYGNSVGRQLSWKVINGASRGSEMVGIVIECFQCADQI